jgi:glucose-6-phosphate 1-dehydrogenase
MAKDFYHDSVKKALEKDGWIITHDPYQFKLGKVFFNMDLGAERIISAERENEKIVVEIKSFSKLSFINAFHEAIGQYENYSIALEYSSSERILYLAVPIDVWKTYFQEEFVQIVLDKKQTKIIVYDPVNEQIELWKK